MGTVPVYAFTYCFGANKIRRVSGFAGLSEFTNINGSLPINTDMV